MPDVIRYNKAIDLLEQGKTVFASGLVWNGNLDDLTFIADSDYDMVMIEMEHEGFSLNDLRVSLQFLLNRRRIAEKGNLQPDVVPLVRIPPNSRERNQWIIKQAHRYRPFMRCAYSVLKRPNSHYLYPQGVLFRVYIQVLFL